MNFNVKPFKNEPFTDFTKKENIEIFQNEIKKIESEFGKKYPLIIGGEKIYTKETFKSINPSKKEEVIGEFSIAEKEHIEKALEVAWKAFEEWKRIPA
ncbi:MAG: aldehyde dehydrogenase family protein, partial [candidate division WOR-3 bacterium]